MSDATIATRPCCSSPRSSSCAPADQPMIVAASATAAYSFGLDRPNRRYRGSQMRFRKTLLLSAIGVCYVSASIAATLRNVDVSRDHDRYRVVADTHLDAS